MAQFDDSGCPTEFLTILRQLEAEIQNVTNLVAKEKQLIEGNEKEIAAKRKATEEQQEKNAQLEISIQHLNFLYYNQTKHIESLREAGELLKEQVKNKLESLQLLRDKIQMTKNECEGNYQVYVAKFAERMQFYETFPHVPEYKKQLERLVELHGIIEVKEKVKNALKEEIESLKAQQDGLKPQFTSITEWGTALAQLMQEFHKKRTDAVDSYKSVKILKSDIAKLEARQSEIKEAKARALTEAQAKANEMVNNTKSLTPKDFPAERSLELEPISKPSSFPDFKSFFKDLGSRQEPHASGSSGSSLRGSSHCSSLPNISALFSPTKAKLQVIPEAPTMQKVTFPLKEKTEKNKPDTTNNEETGDNSKLHRSQSLTMLLPKVKPVKQRNEPANKIPFKTGRSLADWLKPPSMNKQAEKNDKMDVVEISSEQQQKWNKKEKSFKGRSKMERMSWPFAASSSHISRMTEVPLLRQVQEKMFFQKRGKEEEAGVCESNDVAQMEIENADRPANVEQANTGNVPGYFDGPVYDVPMPTEEEVEHKEQLKNTRNILKSPTSTGGPKSCSLEEHERLMAELQKSPEDTFQFMSNIMPTEGGENSFLISPTHQTAQAQMSSPPGLPTSPPEEFHFAVPTAPAPGHGKRGGWSPLAETIGFGSSMEAASPEETQSPFGGFSFGGAGDASTTQSESFSFMFGGGEGSKEASESSNPFQFSFQGGSPTSPEESGCSLFGGSGDAIEDTSVTSFSAIFGCGK